MAGNYTPGKDTIVRQATKENGEKIGVEMALLKQDYPPPSAQVNIVYLEYPERWWILITTVCLISGNYAHWIAFPSVGKSVAIYYNETGQKTDLIPTLSTAVGVPFCLVATYIAEASGLKAVIHISALVTALGELLCLLSSMPGLSEILDTSTTDSKYLMALIGQALTGIAAPFLTIIPTKLSQHWFGDNKWRTVAVVACAGAPGLGLLCGHSLTPLFVHHYQDVYLLNIIWFTPTFIVALLALLKIRSSLPPTPPSRSSALQIERERKTYAWLRESGKVVRNRSAVILILFLSCGIAYSSALATKLEQMMCSVGYSDQMSGLAASMIVICGVAGSMPIGFLMRRLENTMRALRIVLVVLLLPSMIAITYLVRLPNQAPAILTALGVYGLTAYGFFPIGLEHLSEITYPVDESIGVAMVYLLGFIKGTFLLLIENAMGSPLNQEEMQYQVCVDKDDDSHQQPKNYTTYLIFISCYFGFFTILAVLLIKSQLHRRDADRGIIEISN